MTKPIKLAVLIDDAVIDQRLYKRVLDRSGLVERVELFSYADDALGWLNDHPEEKVDVIFLDINMPRMNGFEFLTEATATLGQGFAKVVVAMLTTSLNPDDLTQAKTFQVVKDFINKPLAVEHIKRIAAMM